jgi:hypothetical protein
MQEILAQIYHESLEPIVKYTQSIVRVGFQIHSLGLADEGLIHRAYDEYAARLGEHPQVLYEELSVFEYDSAPWAILFVG